jgi:thymidine phosphorylase
MRERKQARALARSLVDVSTQMGKHACALVTSMDRPLGHAVGNALEIRESVQVLRGEGPADVTELTLALAAEMIRLADLAPDASRATEIARETVSSGAALERFGRWIEAQGGDPRVVDDPDRLPHAPVVRELVAPRDAWLAALETRDVGFAANALGAGRRRLGDPVDPAVGFVFRAKTGDEVARGEPWVEIHAASEPAAADATRRLEALVTWSQDRPALLPLVLETVAAA